MSDRRRWLVLLPRELRDLPADLVAVVVLTVTSVVVATFPVVRETPLRVVFGLAFVLFVPGYALIAALFPEQGEAPVDHEDDTAALEGPGESRDGIDGIERVALSFGLSIAVVPLVGLVLNFTPWGIRLVPILVGVGGLTLILTALAAQRRWALPEDERFRVPYRDWYRAGRSELLEPADRTDAALNVLLVLSVLLASASVAYAVTVPKEGESFTEFYLLTETTDGELVADDYPTEFAVGESKPLVVGIGNHEHERVRYSVVTELQAVRFANNSTLVTDQRELGRFGTVLADNRTWHRQYDVRPTMTGDRLRLQFLLYRGDPPTDPRTANAYRETHLWVNVTSGE